MRVLKRILLFPVFILVIIMSIGIKILVKAECWVAGVGFLLLAIFAVLALKNQMWLQLGVFVFLFIMLSGTMIFSAHILLRIETLQSMLSLK